MTSEQLLGELEPLSHRERLRRMVQIGRAARTDAAVAAMLASLREGDVCERWLAIQACHGSREGSHAMKALADASERVRGLAVDLIPLICDDAQVQAALKAASQRERRALLRRLAQRGRRAPLDAFLSSQAGRDAAGLAAILRFGSATIVEAHLEAALDVAGTADWRRLARRHPEMAAAALCRRVEATRCPDAELVEHANGVLKELVTRAPEEALMLVDVMVRHIPPADLRLQQLVSRRPVEMADRVLRWEGRANVLFTWTAHRLDRERFRALVERRFVTLGDLDRWLPRLPPDWRAYLVDAVAAEDWRGQR